MVIDSKQYSKNIQFLKIMMQFHISQDTVLAVTLQTRHMRILFHDIFTFAEKCVIINEQDKLLALYFITEIMRRIYESQLLRHTQL